MGTPFYNQRTSDHVSHLLTLPLDEKRVLYNYLLLKIQETQKRMHVEKQLIEELQRRKRTNIKLEELDSFIQKLIKESKDERNANHVFLQNALGMKSLLRQFDRNDWKKVVSVHSTSWMMKLTLPEILDYLHENAVRLFMQRIHF